ncbi:MAG TPA: hypothetical protein VEU08_12505 [Vicinamibacterales bacterium]|nr:hypothetical protein [Vicinamibacterales bacterium]
MNRIAILALSAAIVIPFTARAQSKPDFSGTWTMDASKSDPAPQGRRGGMGGGSQTVKQTATEITIESQGRGGAQTMVYKLDGSKSMNKVMGRGGEQSVESTAKWDGSTLVIETTRDFGGQSVTTKETRKMDGANMVVETSFNGNSRKVVYTKGM